MLQLHAPTRIILGEAVERQQLASTCLAFPPPMLRFLSSQAVDTPSRFAQPEAARPHGD